MPLEREEGPLGLEAVLKRLQTSLSPRKTGLGVSRVYTHTAF